MDKTRRMMEKRITRSQRENRGRKRTWRGRRRGMRNASKTEARELRSAAAAAAAAIAARLIKKHEDQHDQQQLAGNGSKRPREGDDGEDGEPDRKRGVSVDGDGQHAGEENNKAAAPDGQVVERFMVPHDLVGKLIGRRGETIRNMQQVTGTRIQVDHQSKGAQQREITVTGLPRRRFATQRRRFWRWVRKTRRRWSSALRRWWARLLGEEVRLFARSVRVDAKISVNQSFRRISRGRLR
jgi:hypothetical protein